MPGQPPTKSLARPGKKPEPLKVEAVVPKAKPIKQVKAEVLGDLSITMSCSLLGERQEEM